MNVSVDEKTMQRCPNLDMRPTKKFLKYEGGRFALAVSIYLMNTWMYIFCFVFFFFFLISYACYFVVDFIMKHQNDQDSEYLDDRKTKHLWKHEVVQAAASSDFGTTDRTERELQRFPFSSHIFQDPLDLEPRYRCFDKSIRRYYDLAAAHVAAVAS